MFKNKILGQELQQGETNNLLYKTEGIFKLYEDTSVSTMGNSQVAWSVYHAHSNFCKFHRVLAEW